MGKGMKRSTRSLVGMFRPKSVASINSMENAGPEVTTVICGGGTSGPAFSIELMLATDFGRNMPTSERVETR
jgi:hypothetical protein